MENRARVICQNRDLCGNILRSVLGSTCMHSKPHMMKNETDCSPCNCNVIGKVTECEECNIFGEIIVKARSPVKNLILEDRLRRKINA